MRKKFLYFIVIGMMLFSSGCTLLKIALSAAAAYGISQAIGD